MSKSEKAPGGVTPEQSGKKLPGFVKKAGALVLAVLAAGGIWNKANEPAMNGEQMREATNVAATAALDKVNEIKDSSPDLNDNDGSYFIGEGGMAIFFVYDGDPDGDTAKGSGTNVEISITDDKSSGERGVSTSTQFVFSTEDESALDKINADNKVSWSEVKEFLGRPDVNVSKIQSHEDSNRDGEYTPETLKYNVYDGGDDEWALHISKKDGTKGYSKNNSYSGKKAVELTQEVVNHVKSNWSSGKTKK